MLIAERGLAAVTIEQIAEGLGCEPADVLTHFPHLHSIVSDNDYFVAIVDAFRSSDDGLSCSAAWIVALDERAATITDGEWAMEGMRQHLMMVEEPTLGNMVSGISAGMSAMAEAVSKRCGAPADSPGVTAFVGTVLGLQLVMPTGAYANAHEWTEAHAHVMETLGAGLDALLR